MKWWTDVFGLCEKPFDKHSYSIPDGEFDSIYGRVYYKKCTKCNSTIGKRRWK